MIRIPLYLKAILILIVSFSCSKKHEEEPAAPIITFNRLTLSEAQVQLANISTVEVRQGSIGQELSFTGIVKVNEESASTVSVRVPGRIEKLYFRNTGERVEKGDKLYDFYSEDLISEQREYIRLQANNWNFSATYEPRLGVEERLMVMGMLPSQIKQLAKDGKVLFTITIYSQVSGWIRSVDITEGQYVKEGTQLYSLADDKDLWIEAQVYPDEINYIKTGMPAKIFLPETGEVTSSGGISFINPSFEKGRNITLVRTGIENHSGRIHPGMFAIIKVIARTQTGIVIPSTAIISDSSGDKVWIQEHSGAFSPRKVQTGLLTSDSAIVLAGLAEGERVVTSGVYLLNSEMILRQGAESPAAAASEKMMAEGHK